MNASKHGGQAQVEEHDEEQHGPDLRARHLYHRFGEHNEHQAGTRSTLREEDGNQTSTHCICLYSITEHYYGYYSYIDESVPGQGTFEGRRTSVPTLQPHSAVCWSDIQPSVCNCPGLCSGLQSQSGWSEIRCCCR